MKRKRWTSCEMRKDIPLVFLAHGLKRETAAEFILKGAADCIELDSIGHLPVAVHRALEEKTLRNQRERAEKELRRSEARYRALAGNLSFGICRCSREGRFLEVNEAMMRMLGYESKEELLAKNLMEDIIQDPARRSKIAGSIKRNCTCGSGRDRMETQGLCGAEGAVERSRSARRAERFGRL
jgi:PAS domain S-box-containing protein